MWDEAKFNPIAYANFTPNLDVLYEMPVSQRATTTFELGTAFKPKVQFRAVSWDMFFGWYQPDGSSSYLKQYKTEFSVDWGSPLFMAEAHVRLRSLTANNLCLTANLSEEGLPQVIGDRCNETFNQKWGLDKFERYKSMAGDNQCFDRLDDGSLTVDSCNDNLSQKWFWCIFLSDPNTDSRLVRTLLSCAIVSVINY